MSKCKDPNSIRQRAAALDIPVSTVYHRMQNKYWDVERALFTPVNPKFVVGSAARMAGIKNCTVHSRLRRGWSMEDALRIPARKGTGSHPLRAAT